MASRIFITGITGTLGTALVNLHHEKGDSVWGCSRSESKAVQWLREHGKKATLFLSDVARLTCHDTDISRLLPSMDRVYHCAAMKHVDLCEKHPIEALLSNVAMTDIVAQKCHALQIPCVHISSDKACLPQSVYGATKLLSEKTALRHGASVVRLGNVIGSSGSVFHHWRECLKGGKPITLTDPEMTRFFLTVGEAASFVAHEAQPGCVVIPFMKSVRMGDIANVLCQSSASITTAGPRPGETKHQWLLAPGDCWYSDEMSYVLTEKEPAKVYRIGLSSESAVRWDTRLLLQEVMK